MEYGDAASSNLIFMVFGAAILYALLLTTERSAPNLKHITSFGYQGYLLSYADALKALFYGPTLVQRGYDQNTAGLFKFATLHRWLIIVTGMQHIEEMRKASTDEISSIDAVSEPDVARYLMGHLVTPNTQQATVLTRYLSQNLPFLMPDIRDELVATIADTSLVPSLHSGWGEICGEDLVAPWTARTVDRVFFGLTFARDKAYRQLSSNSVTHSLDFKTLFTPSLFPRSFRNILLWFSESKKTERQIRKMLTAHIREEKQNIAIKGHSHDFPKSNDILFQILHNDIARGMVDLESTILSMGSIVKHTLALAFGHTLNDLASNPTQVVLLRQEIKNVASRQGWTRSSLDKMHTLDSFVKESMRINVIFTLSTIRRTLKPYTFSDGVHIPKNTFLAVPASSRHLDHTLYPSASTFDGFRFSSLYERHRDHDHSSGGGDVQYSLTTSNTAYLPWGSGRHTCPGRFFAAAALKMMLAHVLLNYEVKFEDGKRPPNIIADMNCLPDLRAKLLIRRYGTSLNPEFEAS